MKALFAIAVLSLALPALRAPSAEASTAPAAKRRKPSRIQREPKKASGPLRPVNITSKSFEVSPGSQTAVWSGEVVVEREGVRVTCDRLTAQLDDSKQVRAVTCQGNAHMIQRPTTPDRPEREAWGEVAVFDNERAVLTVTGSPRAREGESTMKGTKVIFLVEEDRVLVENVEMILETSKANPALGDGAGGRPK
ncbi:MAG TPA: hypothetical protein DFS52_20825 [Myxococcales bacterium]|jgi:lipopolysaccharide export system protein LptA|nr:hypothetical protein [Myxococcales bacterium]